MVTVMVDIHSLRLKRLPESSTRMVSFLRMVDFRLHRQIDARPQVLLTFGHLVDDPIGLDFLSTDRCLIFDGLLYNRGTMDPGAWLEENDYFKLCHSCKHNAYPSIFENSPRRWLQLTTRKIQPPDSDRLVGARWSGSSRPTDWTGSARS